jgi:methylmalonyl-CoA mutase C-terminal domain/subunit
MSRARPRVLLVECGSSALALGRVLRDAGMEVVHAGPLEAAEQIIRTAEQEDPDALGIVGAPPPGELSKALPGVRLFALAEYADPGANVFETPEKAAEWLAGGRSHTR